jgi:hypothetical protein
MNMKFRRIVLPAVLTFLLCVITTVVLRQSRSFTTPDSLPSEVASAPVAQAAGERGPVRMIRFALFENSLYPRSMRVDQGLVNIAIEDKTNMSEGLALERVVNGNSERVITVRRVQNHWRGRELLRLTPGQYVVYDVSKPDNKAELIVEP